MLVRELVDGQEIEAVLVVRGRRMRSGRPELTLADRTGSVAAIVPEVPAGCEPGQVVPEAPAGCEPGQVVPEAPAGCEPGQVVPEVPAWCEPGQVVHVAGRYAEGRVEVSALRPAREDEYALEDLLDGPPRSATGMESDLRELLATVQNPHLRALLDAVFGPASPTWRQFRDAPAAKRYHQAYRHGLLEHCLTVAQAVSAISATFPGIDRDVAVTGALLHDIGKLEAYTAEPLAIDMTDLGKLQGEIALGYYRIRRLIEDVPGFPEQLAAAVLHIILSHHGTLEHGSPVVPCTREATLVHMIDNLGGRLGSFDRLEKELPYGTRWSPFDRALAGSAWFAGREAA